MKKLTVDVSIFPLNVKLLGTPVPPCLIHPHIPNALKVEVQ